MYDLRQTKNIDLSDAVCLKEETTYKFTEKNIGKELIVKFISNYDDSEDFYLITEFKKLAILSGEPEIATVYYLAKAKIEDESKSCYIMEFVKGQTLDEFLKKRTSIIYEVLLDLILQLASGMEKAHNYEIYHNDLHNENILINDFGYLKIIDFLWQDYNLTGEVNQEKDLSDFKRIVEEFEQKCRDSDKTRFKLISDYCKSITSFKDLKKEIQLLDEVSFDLSLLDDKSLSILSKLFELTTLNQIKMAVESRNVPIPEITEIEKGYVEQHKTGLKNKYLDSRKGTIDLNFQNIFSKKFLLLKQLALIDWDVWITNTGETFLGPYQYNFRILFTSKFLRLKKVNELIPFVEINSKMLEDLIIE